MNYSHASHVTHATPNAQVREISARVATPYTRGSHEAEGLHWALRTSFVALVSPRAWLDALLPERSSAHK